MGLDKNLGLDNAFKAVYKPIHINFGTCILIFSHEYYSRFVSMRFSHDRKETMLVLQLSTASPQTSNFWIFFPNVGINMAVL